MFIDLHAHTSGISTCCRVPAPDIIAAAQSVGLDGIVLTNHYQRAYIKDGDCEKFAKRYTDEYYYTKECGDAVGFKVFYGMELTMEKHSGAHVLVYGISPEFTLEHPDMFSWTLEELHPFIRKNGGMLVQAHPFRGGRDLLQNVADLDGVEANSHPLYDATHVEKLTKIAQNAGIILTSGGDYHADTHRPHCGAYLPDSIRTERELCDFLLSAEMLDIQIQDPADTQSRRVTYVRHPQA